MGAGGDAARVGGVAGRTSISASPGSLSPIVARARAIAPLPPRALEGRDSCSAEPVLFAASSPASRAR